MSSFPPIKQFSEMYASISSHQGTYLYVTVKKDYICIYLYIHIKGIDFMSYL